MAESVSLEFTGDAAGLAAEIKKLQSELAKLKMGMDDTAKAGVKGYGEQKAAMEEMRRFSARVAEQVKTDDERRVEQLRKLQVAYSMGKLSAEQYDRAVKQASESTQVMAKSTDAIGDTAGATIAGMVTGWLSVGSVIAMANQTLIAHVALQEKARERQVTAGQGRASLAFNAGGDMSTETVAKMMEEVAAASKGTMLSSPDQMMAGAAMAISSIAESDPKKRAAKVSAIAGAVGDIATDATVADLMSTTGQLGQVTGAETKGEYRRSLALAASAMSMANITDPRGMAFAGRAGAISLANAADGVDKERTMKDSLALWAATTVAMKDRTGEASATAVGDFSKSLREFAEKNNVAGKADMERLAAIRENPALVAGFREKVGGGQASPLYLKLLDAKSDFSQAVAGNMAGINPDEAALDQIAANMRATSQQRIAENEASLKALNARWSEANPARAKASQIRDLLGGYIRERGSTGWGVGLNDMSYNMQTMLGADPALVAKEIATSVHEKDRFERDTGMVSEERARERDQAFADFLAELRKITENLSPPSAPPPPGNHREQGTN